MNNNIESNIDGETRGVDGDRSVQTSHKNSDRDDGEQVSAQSNDDCPSPPPDTSDDITSDECKPPLAQTEDRYVYGVDNIMRKPTALHRNVNKSFAMQLMDMLNSEAEADSDAVQWLPDGRGFMIKRQNEFERQIMPKYFDSPCIFQSFTRRLYRWGFKQIDKSMAGSGNYVFTNEVFDRDNDKYLNMKPLSRHKNESQEAIKDRNREKKPASLDVHNSVTVRNSSTDNSLTARFRSHGVNARSATSPGLAARVDDELAANENIPTLPPQLAAQNELITLANTIIASHSPSPVLTSLQSDSNTIIHAQLNSIEQQLRTLRSYMSQTLPSSTREPPIQNIDGLVRALMQGHPSITSPGRTQNLLPPNIMHQVHGQASSHLPSPITVQHQLVTPALFPSTTQGYSPPVQQSVSRLSASNLQLLMGIQSRLQQIPGYQARQYSMPTNGSDLGPNIDTPTTSTLSSPSEDPCEAVLGHNVDTSTTSTTSSSNEDCGGAVLCPNTRTTTTATSSPSSPSEDQTMHHSTRKRTRPTSPDK